MKALFLYKPKDLRYEEIEIPEISEEQVLIKIKACGICGSDVHYYNMGRIGPYEVKKQIILGHECSGQIIKVGSKVKNFKKGDRVAIEPGVPCGLCEHCRSGRYNLCKDVVFMATPPYHGAFTEYVAYHQNYIYKLPPNVSYEEGAMIEPLSVGVHAAMRSGAKMGDFALVLGAGPIGLMTIGALAARGVTQIIASDLEEYRLKLALKMGATEIINARKERIDKEIINLTGGKGADLVFETAGSETTIKSTTDLVKRGGTVIWIGLGPDEVPIKVGDFVDKELEVKGVFRYAHVFPIAIDLVARGKINIKPLITHVFKFDEIKEAFKVANKKQEKSIKIMIKY